MSVLETVSDWAQSAASTISDNASKVPLFGWAFMGLSSAMATGKAIADGVIQGPAPATNYDKQPDNTTPSSSWLNQVQTAAAKAVAATATPVVMGTAQALSPDSFTASGQPILSAAGMPTWMKFTIAAAVILGVVTVIHKEA